MTEFEMKTLVDMFDERMDRRFDSIDERLDAMDKRFDGMDKRLDAMDKRLDGIDERLDAMDKRLDGIDERLDAMDKRFDAMDKRQDEMDERFDRIEKQISGLYLEIENRITPLTELLQGHVESQSRMLDKLNKMVERHDIEINTINTALRVKKIL